MTAHRLQFRPGGIIPPALEVGVKMRYCAPDSSGPAVSGGPIGVGTAPNTVPGAATKGIFGIITYQAPTDPDALQTAYDAAGLYSLYDFSGLTADSFAYLNGQVNGVYSSGLTYDVGRVRGSTVWATYDGTGDCNDITGIAAYASISGGGQSSQGPIGIDAQGAAQGAATVAATIIGGQFTVQATDATVTNAICAHLLSIGVACTNNYGLKVGAVTGGTNNYGIYVASINNAANDYAIKTGLGIVDLGDFVQLTERATPASPAANKVRIYAKDNGAGKTQLMALFATGAAQQIAIEP